MNAVPEAFVMSCCCASCGAAEVDDIKLMECDACDLVRYCGYKCQLYHRPQHESTCKERATELRDDLLFKQPESSHLGDCPICFLPLSLDITQSLLQTCCSKRICNGCAYANTVREFEENLQFKCPFCRCLIPTTGDETKANEIKRVAANDPIEMRETGIKNYYGDYDSAFEYSTKAAGLGDVDAHYILSNLYLEGQGVEKDEKKGTYHLEEAAIAGYPSARYSLGCYEWVCKRFDRSVKHFIIAANLGHDISVHALKRCYKDGLVSKEDFAAALRANQAIIDASKSPQREEAPKNVDAAQEEDICGRK